MPSSQYNPLTGKDIRTIAKLRINNEIDKLPYLREGNAFHNVNVQIVIVITAYPADVPVPNLDLEFDIPSNLLDEVGEYKNQLGVAEAIANKIENLAAIEEALVQRIENIRADLLEKRAALVYESEIDPSFNGNTPDQTRIENGIPVTIERVEKGKRVETKIAPMEFKKMVK